MFIKMSLIPGNKKGKIGKISVEIGDKVNEGDILAQVETAKGNRVVKASSDGKITNIFFEEGEEIASNEIFFELIEEDNKIIEKELSTNKVEKDINTELLIIGAGPGGYVAAIYAAKQGLKTTLIEREYLGGTCLNIGCIPTKALIKSSEVYNSALNADIFGIDILGKVKLDLSKAIRHKNEIKDKLVNGIDYLLKENNVNLITGNAEFLSKKEVLVTGEENYKIIAENIIIATGSKVSNAPIEGVDSPIVMDSTDILDNTDLPESLTIIGGGVIGMEFAFMYSNFGVKVNLIEYEENILSMLDKDISKEITKEAEKKGIKIYTKSEVIRIQQSIDRKAVVTYKDKDGEKIIISDKLLSATGRIANTDNLNIENSGVEIDKNKKSIIVDEYMKTNVENIYAIGDVTDIMQLAHVASHQGFVAVDNILGKNRKMDYDAVPEVIFTSPEIATAGISEDKANELNIDYSIGRFDYAGNGKALSMNQDVGFIKIIKNNRNNRIIGASIIGADASSLISVLTLAIKNGLTDKDITKTIFAHPTTSEVIHEAALDLGIGALHQ